MQPGPLQSRVECCADLNKRQTLAYQQCVLQRTAARLAQEACGGLRLPERAFLCNSGAEANEAAIKLVRKWASAQGRAPEQRTVSSLSTAASYAPWPPSRYRAAQISVRLRAAAGGFRYVDFNDPGAGCGNGGRRCGRHAGAGTGRKRSFLPPRAICVVRALCDRHAALVLDEIQAGMGRTGSLFALLARCRFRARYRLPGQGTGGGFPDRRTAGRPQGRAGHGSLAHTAPRLAAIRWPPPSPASPCAHWLPMTLSPTYSARRTPA